jgi:hypothetical protein
MYAIIKFRSILLSIVFISFSLIGCGGGGDGGGSSSNDANPADANTPVDPVVNTGPRILLIEPTTNLIIPTGTTSTFTAAASDPEDGNLDNNMQWASSQQGLLGTGGTITTQLADGVHSVTVSVADSGGLSTEQSFMVSVQQPSAPVNTAPSVSVATPSGNTFTEDEPVLLTGQATDVEDGNLSSSIRWLSSIDGELPVTGAAFSRQLSIGSHTISAHATDSEDVTGFANISITVLSVATAANAFYVDINHPDASDSNPGTEGEPWETIAHAADTLTTGQTAYIKAGRYDGDVDVANSGERGAEIVITAYPGDERKAVVYQGVFNIEGKSHIKVLGLKVENSDHRGFYVEGPEDPYGPPSENITLAGNHTYDTYSSGFSVWGRPYQDDPGNFINIVDLVIEHNLIEMAVNGGHNECITLANGVVRADVRYNEITTGGDPANGGEGIDFKDGIRDSNIYGNYIHGLNRRSIYVDGGRTEGAVAKNIHIYDNLIVNDPSSAIMVSSEGVGNVDGVYIYNNLVLGSGQNGIGVYDHPRGRGISTVKNIAIVNNTVIDGGRDGSGWGNISTNHPEATNMLVRNNITLSGNGFDIKTSGDTTVDHNLCRESLCEVQGDPKFVNPTFDGATADYSLRSDSPAIDQGVATEAPAFDREGTPRPQGGAYDLGAYEYAP